MKNFVLIGAAGYIAPRHMQAIKETGNNLLAALDKHDSVGVLDDYFPEADFFTEFERFDRHIEKLKRQGQAIDYVTVCSPNYLHDAHIRFGLRIGANVICEKPVALNPWNVEALIEIEKELKGKVNIIHQLRLHPALMALHKKIREGSGNKKYDVKLNYISARGNWYKSSWKGDIDKSGGIVTNIGLHFFDLLLWIFGDVKTSSVDRHDADMASGKLELEHASVSWMLSIDPNKLPKEVIGSGNRTFRSLVVNDDNIQFDNGFTELHTRSYEEILAGNGLGLTEALPVIRLVHQIRNCIK